MQALFYLKTLAVVAAITSFMFHVKHTQGESSDHTCVGIAEPKYVDL